MLTHTGELLIALKEGTPSLANELVHYIIRCVLLKTVYHAHY